MKNNPGKPAFSNKLIQVGIVVKDIKKTVERLESLGIGPFYAPPPPPEKALEYYQRKVMDAKFKVLIAKIGDLELEIFEPVSGESPWKEFLDNKGEGIHHIAFASNDPFKEADSFISHGASEIFNSKTTDGRSCVYLDLGVGNIIFELFKV
jgi:methylmalonyl-CoA/ethylmalonyl-CoA epimerase